MILKGSQRASARALGAHLLNKSDNEHVEVHEVRGFMSEDVMGAMTEVEAIAKGTRCRQHIFSLSLNPPETENVRAEVFETALSKVEERLGLSGQPRIVVFHEKEGRRHCHAAWSRIDAQTMTAIPLPFFKNRLREVSREMYLEHGWKMPRGLIDSAARDPRNFDLAEWQQAKRTGRNARDLKAIMQECWAASDSTASFAKALEERGLYLARGDRRGHVAVTYEGEVFSIARQVGKPTKEITARLGEPNFLRDVEATRAHIASVIAPRLRGFLSQAEATQMLEAERLNTQRQAMRDRHADERRRLDAGQRAREESEGRVRAERMRKGLLGVWDKMRGEYSRLRKQNELEAYMALGRDRLQRDTLRAVHLEERRALQEQIRLMRQRHALRVAELHRDLARQRTEPPPPQQPAKLVEQFGREAKKDALAAKFDRLRERTQQRQPNRGPDLER